MKKALIFTMIFCLFLLAGCARIPYNLTVYSHAEDWASEEFLQSNAVKLTGFADEPDGGLPQSRKLIVLDLEEFDNIFPNCDVHADFGREIVLVYTFGDVYKTRDYTISEASIDSGSVLNITCKLEKKSGVGDASAPYQRVLLFKMDRQNISDFTVNLK